VFLDRDGTMIHDVGYLARLEDVRWFSATIDAIRLLKRSGFLVIVLSNQGGVGLGLFEETFVHRVHDAMAKEVDAAGGHVDGWFYCPHHPRATIESLRVACECRKPRLGMLHQAQQQFDIDLTRSFVVGDKESDVELARNAGLRGILVRTGYGEAVLRQGRGVMPSAAVVVPDVMAAASWILARSGHPREAT